MRWQGSLLALALMGPAALAEEPPLNSSTTPAPLMAPVAVPTTIDPACPTLFSDVAGDGSTDDLLKGNRRFPNFIGFMSNPIQSIDPRAVTELYPLFGASWVSPSAPLPSGSLQLYGAGLTVALGERFAFGMNQGGYATSQFPRQNRDGWMNLGGFAQYTLINDCEDQFLLTAGLHLTVPTGEAEVFQGHGPSKMAPYITMGKECGDFHVLSISGYQFPLGSGASDTKIFFTNVHFDKQMWGWFYPLVEFNWSYHTTSVSASNPGHDDFFDFGTFSSTGNIVVMAVGANAVIVKERLEFGAAYNTAIYSQHDFNVNGLLAKLVIRY